MKVLLSCQAEEWWVNLNFQSFYTFFMKNGKYLDWLFIYRFVSFESRADVACFGPLGWTLDSVRTQVNKQVGPFGQFTNLELDRTLRDRLFS